VTPETETETDQTRELDRVIAVGGVVGRVLAVCALVKHLIPDALRRVKGVERPERPGQEK